MFSRCVGSLFVFKCLRCRCADNISLWVYLCLPEVKDRTLEEIDEMVSSRDPCCPLSFFFSLSVFSFPFFFCGTNRVSSSRLAFPPGNSDIMSALVTMMQRTQETRMFSKTRKPQRSSARKWDPEFAYTLTTRELPLFRLPTIVLLIKVLVGTKNPANSCLLQRT